MVGGGVTTTRGTALEGSNIRKVENHCRSLNAQAIWHPLATVQQWAGMRVCVYAIGQGTVLMQEMLRS